jgi:glycosyltransferase involved in cell wall biosynthesis
MSLSVIYPAYNEELNIRGTIQQSLDALHPRLDEFEILIIDDASKDQTGAIADELARQHSEITVLHNAINKGQGECLRVAFRQARHEWVIHNAMDYPFDLRDLDMILPLTQDADIIVAARKSRSGYSPYRKLASAVNLFLLNLLFGLGLHDYNFVQLYRKDVLNSVPVETNSTAFLTPEILIRAHDLGFRIREVEVEYHPRERGAATSGNPRVVLKSIRDMLRFWLKYRSRRQASR